MERRFGRFGGVARVVLAHSIAEHENDLEAAIHSSDVDEVLKAVNKADAANSVTHKILQYDVVDESLRRVQARFASDYVARRCCDEMLRLHEDRMLRFLDGALSRPALGNLPGTMFERWMHKMLVGGGSFNIRRLETKSSSSRRISLSTRCKPSSRPWSCQFWSTTSSTD